MKNHDWLPSSYEDLDDQSSEVKNFAEKHADEYGMDSKWIKNTFVPAWEVHHKAVEVWKVASSRTPVVIETLRDARVMFEPIYRKLYTYIKGNPNITNADLVAMGLPARSHDKPTPMPIPSTIPVLEVEATGTRRVTVTFRDSVSKSAAKPKGVSGAVIRWGLLPEPPSDITMLPESVLDTKSPFHLSFKENERGKTVYVAAAWQNTRGEKGNWSEIRSAIIS